MFNILNNYIYNKQYYLDSIKYLVNISPYRLEEKVIKNYIAL